MGATIIKTDKSDIVVFILICCFIAGCSVLRANKKEHANVIAAKDDVYKSLLIRDVETNQERVFRFVPIPGNSSDRDVGGMFQYDLLRVGDTIKIQVGHLLESDQYYYEEGTLLMSSDFRWRVMDKKDIKHRQDSIKHVRDSIKRVKTLKELKQQFLKDQRYTK